MPALTHIYVLILENKDYTSVVGGGEDPYINSLIAQYGLATGYQAITHPSEPNYLALFSGSTQGVTDDGVHNVSAANLADQLESHGKSWMVFAQNVPSGCFKGDTASGGVDGPGTYARKHNPAISFTDISGDPARCARITDFSHFDPTAADFELIIPNTCNDGHDCSLHSADVFLRSFVPRITGAATFANSALFIVWDESVSEGSDGAGGGRVPLIVVSPQVPTGYQTAAAYTHYSLLRSIEDAWGLGCLKESCSAKNLAEFFGR